MADAPVAPPLTDTSGVPISVSGGSPVPITPTISSATIQPQAPIPYSSPAPTFIHPVSTLDSSVSPAIQNGPATDEATSLTKSLEDLNNALSGKASAQTAAETAAGIPALTKTQNDLSAQLEGLKNEATAIPLSLQNQSIGRGITAAGLQPIQDSQLRENAVKALTISTLLTATKGNLADAQAQADRVVKQQFDPIQAKIDAATANLKLIINSPQYSNEEKTQAQNQLAAQNTKQAQLDQAKTDKANILNIATTAASNGADALTLQKITQAATPADALTAAGDFAGSTVTGRYKDITATITDAYGGQSQVIHVLDTRTGQFVNANGKTAAQLNAPGADTSKVTPIGPAPAGTGNTSVQDAGSGPQKLSLAQYGLLANTDFNPTNTVDGLAQKYLDQYVKNGSVPTASTLGRNMKPAAVAQVDARARQLYYQATGHALPNPEIIKGYQTIVNSNNEFTNNLVTQESTVRANFGLSLENLQAADLNKGGNNALNNFIDYVKQYWIGNPQAAQYALQNSTVTNEIGSLLAVRNASGTTVHDKLVSSGLIPPGASIDQQKAMLNTLLAEAANAKNALATANEPLYKQIDPLLQDTNNPLTQKLQNTNFVNSSLQKLGFNYNSLITEMQQVAPAHPGTVPALDAKTGQPGFATPEEIRNGAAIAL